MRYLVATWAILALLVLAIHLLVSEAGNEAPVVPSGDVYRAMPGPPVGVVVDATPTPVASSVTLPPLPSPAPISVPVGGPESATEEASPPGSSSPSDERGALIALVHETFPDNARMGNVVAWRETLNLNNWRGYVYGGVWSITSDCGLMQIHWPTHAEKFAAHGWGLEDCFDPAKNLIIAREIYDTSGPWAWMTY